MCRIPTQEQNQTRTKCLCQKSKRKNKIKQCELYMQNIHTITKSGTNKMCVQHINMTKELQACSLAVQVQHRVNTAHLSAKIYFIDPQLAYTSSSSSSKFVLLGIKWKKLLEAQQLLSTRIAIVNAVSFVFSSILYSLHNLEDRQYGLTYSNPTTHLRIDKGMESIDCAMSFRKQDRCEEKKLRVQELDA